MPSSNPSAYWICNCRHPQTKVWYADAIADAERRAIEAEAKYEETRDARFEEGCDECQAREDAANKRADEVEAKLAKFADAARELAVQLSPVKTARTEQNLNIAHEMAERLKVELRNAAATLADSDPPEEKQLESVRKEARGARRLLIWALEYIDEPEPVSEPGNHARYHAALQFIEGVTTPKEETK